MALTKPPVKPVWAELGTNPADIIVPLDAEIQAGWPNVTTPPARQRFNWVLNFCANGIRYLTRRGMPDWAADETYEIHDIVRGPNFLLYRSRINTNINHSPAASPNQWERFGNATSRIYMYDYFPFKDGTTSDQTVVAAAVADAFALGAELYWGPGTYLTTANIPNFHDVIHRGPGVVKRNSALFKVEPKDNQTNNLYVSSSGSNSNDGIDATQPMLTGQKAGDVIMGYPYGDNTWIVNFSAGTYITSNWHWFRPFPSSNRIQFNGVNKANGVVPTTIFQGPGGGAQYGFYFQNHIRVSIDSILFKQYRDGATPDFNGNSNAALFDTYVDVYMRNVHVQDCDYGLFFSSYCRNRVEAGVIKQCAVGVSAIFHCTNSIGYAGSAADITGTTGTAIYDCTILGALVQENSTGHFDYVYFGQSGAVSGIGLQMNISSRAHCIGSSFTNLTHGVELYVNSHFFNTSCTFTGCTTDRYVLSGSKLGAYVPASNIDEGDLRSINFEGQTTTQQTQSTTDVIAYTRTFLAKELQNRTAGFGIEIVCSIIGNAGTKTITVELGGVTLVTNANLAATASTVIRVKMWVHVASNSLQVLSEVYENGVLPKIVYSNITTVDMTISRDLVVKHKVANAADASRIQVIALETIR